MPNRPRPPSTPQRSKESNVGLSYAVLLLCDRCSLSVVRMRDCDGHHRHDPFVCGAELSRFAETASILGQGLLKFNVCGSGSWNASDHRWTAGLVPSGTRGVAPLGPRVL